MLPLSCRVSYFGKTYFVDVQDDIKGVEDGEVVGFYSANINGLPYIITGNDIHHHESVRNSLSCSPFNCSGESFETPLRPFRVK